MVVQKYVDLAAPEPWQLQLKLRLLESALKRRNGRVILTETTLGEQEAKLRVHYEVAWSTA